MKKTTAEPAPKTTAPVSGPFFQPKAGFQNSPKQSPAFFAPVIQPKLTVGAANSPAEEEADRMGEQVVQRLAQPEPVQRAPMEEAEQKKLQTKPDLQRAPLREEEKLQKKAATEEEDSLQTKPAGDAAAPASVSSQLQSSKGGGKPLEGALRAPVENALGADFGNVRVHTDASAVRMNQALNAQAFTHGKDVYFNEGKYRPETTEGRRLLGHELGHVVQQGEGGVLLLQKDKRYSGAPGGQAKHAPSGQAKQQGITSKGDPVGLFRFMIGRFETLVLSGITQASEEILDKKKEKVNPNLFIYNLISAPLVNIGPNLLQAATNAIKVVIDEAIKEYSEDGQSDIMKYIKGKRFAFHSFIRIILGQSESIVNSVFPNQTYPSTTQEINLMLAKHNFNAGVFDENGELTEQVVDDTEQKVLTTYELSKLYNEMSFNMTGRSKLVYLPPVKEDAGFNMYRSDISGDFEYVELDIPKNNPAVTGKHPWFERTNTKIKPGKYWVINDKRVWKMDLWYQRGWENLALFGAFMKFNSGLVLDYEPTTPSSGQKGMVRNKR